MPAADDQEVVGDFGPEAADPSFSDRVRHRGAVGSADDVGALGPPHLVEGPPELGLVVPDDRADSRVGFSHGDADVAGFWVTQSLAGLAVTPASHTRRDWWWMKNST